MHASLFEINVNNYNVTQHDIDYVNNDTSSLIFFNEILYIGSYKGSVMLFHFEKKCLVQWVKIDCMIQDFKLINMDNHFLIKIHSN